MKSIKSYAIHIRLSLLILFVLLIFTNNVSAHGFGKPTTSYKLPSTNCSGLIDVFFEYVPVFTIEEFQTASGVKLYLNIVLSTTTDLRGSFCYRYLYMGEKNGISAECFRRGSRHRYTFRSMPI